MKTNEGIYFYCFNNKISNNIIIKSNEKINLNSFYIKFCIILIMVKIFEYSNILIIKFMPLYIGFISAIIKYLLQRDAIYILDKYFCNIFYSFGYVIYIYDLLILLKKNNKGRSTHIGIYTRYEYIFIVILK